MGIVFILDQLSEDRGQRTEDRGQKTDDGRQRTEDGGLPEVGLQ